MQPRAKPGGEIGANGEWYEGGKFIATTDHAKSNRKSKKGTGRQEIEPYKWEIPSEPGLRSIWQAMSPGVFTGRLPDGRMGLNPHVSDHTWLYYNDNDPVLVEKAKARFQTLADRFNAGERWFSEEVMQKKEPVAAATFASPYGEEIPQSELSRVGRFEVTLESVGNPDFGQYPGASLPGVPRGRCAVTSLEEAAAKCREFIDEHDLGGGNWSGGDVFEDGTLVARVSYNGRVWRPGENLAAAPAADDEDQDDENACRCRP